MRLLDSIRGRVARPASVRRNLLKTLIQSQTIWLIFFFIGPAGLYRLEEKLHLAPYRFSSRGWRIAGIVLFLLGWLLAYTSAAFMVVKGKGTPLPADATRELVVAGPYRYVRNPMAIGSFAQGVAVGLFLGSPLTTAYALIGATGWNYFVRPWEELDLARRFGRPYVRYRDSVGCWIPLLQPYDSEYNNHQTQTIHQGERNGHHRQHPATRKPHT